MVEIRSNFGFFVFLSILGFGFSANSVTQVEKDAIHRLRDAMGNGEPYQAQYKDYMRKDDYLIRFLKDRNFDLENAKKKLMNTLKWRKENRIDDILKESMGDMGKLFPYEVGVGVDLEGNPLLTVPYGGWNVRRFMVRGDGREKMKRYSAQLLERGSANTRQHNASTGIVIIDMNGYSTRQHGCAACIPFYFDLLNQYEMYYPAYVQNFNFINTPRIWEQVAKVLLPIISPITRDVIQIYGYNKREWQSELLKRINPDQLTPQFGGTKKTKLRGPV